MASVIIIQNNADLMRYRATVEAILRSSVSSIICIGAMAPAQQDSRMQFMPQSSDIKSALQAALQRTNDQRIAIIDARALPTGEDISAITQCDGSASMVYVPLRQKNTDIELPEMIPAAILLWLSSQQTVPALMFSAPRGILMSALASDAAMQIETTADLFVSAMLMAYRDGDSVEMADAVHELMPSEPRPEELKLTGLATSQAIRELVHDANIEELFPQHAWKVHQKESAAAAYHSLAAIFFKFKDLESTQECLTISDRLEDSPRSLALKGLVAMERGETLGAVANLISSLQQYELRKRQSSEHYLVFRPENLDTISENLTAGLSALNQRDNSTALQHFAQAVYQFDPFYREFGVERKMR